MQYVRKVSIALFYQDLVFSRARATPESPMWRSCMLTSRGRDFNEFTDIVENSVFRERMLITSVHGSRKEI